jgi:hypothetical protein
MRSLKKKLSAAQNIFSTILKFASLQTRNSRFRLKNWLCGRFASLRLEKNRSKLRFSCPLAAAASLFPPLPQLLPYLNLLEGVHSLTKRASPGWFWRRWVSCDHRTFAFPEMPVPTGGPRKHTISTEILLAQKYRVIIAIAETSQFSKHRRNS